MNKRIVRSADWVGLGLGAVLLVALTGCADTPLWAAGSKHPPVEQMQSVVVVRDNYLYYPGYEIYYGSNQRQYVYRDGSAWVSRPAPAGISVDRLFATPSVWMNFHDSPERHHQSVVMSYPRNWKMPDEVKWAGVDNTR